MAIRITAVRKEVKTMLEKLTSYKELIDEEKSSELIGNVDDFKSEVEEALDNLNEKDNPNEREETRIYQYEELLSTLEEISSSLETIKDTFEELERNIETLDELSNGTLTE